MQAAGADLQKMCERLLTEKVRLGGNPVQRKIKR
jgi:hypothetical protein